MDQFPSFPDGFDEDDEEQALVFEVEDVAFELPQPEAIEAWIEAVVQHHQAQLSQVQYVFCSDDYLHRMNVEYLDHDTLTDIITFPYAEPPEIAGDIFISIDRVRDNALDFAVPFEHELRRVIIHGILHLCGFGDKSEEDAREMRLREDEALKLWDQMNPAGAIDTTATA